jgi:hypothetical protein
MEDDKGLAPAADRMQIDRCSMLIGQEDVRKPLCLVRPDLREISRR